MGPNEVGPVMAILGLFLFASAILLGGEWT